MGRVGPDERAAEPVPLRLKGGRFLEAVYGVRLAKPGRISIALEAGVASSPLRELENRIASSTRDFASLYVTPALRVKLSPGGRVSPWISAGGGVTLYEQSRERFDGRPNEAERLIRSGHLMLGGGMDFRVSRWLAIRGELRDFYSGNPIFNVPVRGRQHNVTVSAGIVLRAGD